MGEEIRVETDRYLSSSSKIVTDDIDWPLAKRSGITETERFILTYFSDIESQTIVYLRDLLHTKAALEPDVIGFLSMWNYEEYFHGRELARFMKECGYPLEDQRVSDVRKSAALSESLQALTARLLSLVFGDDFPSVHAAWGATQEITTLRAYEELSKITENPVLKTLCDRIAKQERRHFAWYFNSAKERLARSGRARWLTRTLLSHFWSPVGAGVKKDSEVAKLISELFRGPRALEIGVEIDEMIGTLPGLSGIELMVPYMLRNLPASQISLWPRSTR